MVGCQLEVNLGSAMEIEETSQQASQEESEQEPEGESESGSEEEIVVSKFTYKGVEYYGDKVGTIYDMQFVCVGAWNGVSGEVEFDCIT